MKNLILSLAVLTGMETCPQAQTPINAYAKVTGVSGTTLTLSNVNQTYHTFAVGEQVVLIQMQDYVIGNTSNTSLFGTIGSIANAGNYEVATIASLAGMPATMRLSAVPWHTYATGAAVQIVSFNLLNTGNYTLNSAVSGVAWDGNTGGIVAFQVGGTLKLEQSVNADGIGFRGGSLPSDYEVTCEPDVYDTTSSNYAYKGEGINSSPTITYTTHTGRGPLVSGGGGGSDDNGGGGGGGNYTAGGEGGPGWTCTSANASGGLGGLGLGTYTSGGRVFMGGGGGSGAQNNDVGTPGAAGGGIVFIKADELKTNCGSSLSITAAGGIPGNSDNAGAGGAGAGGTVVLAINTFSVPNSCPLTVAANGGDGGNVTDPNSHGGGGGGGQGAVIYSASLPAAHITTTTQSGAGGTNSGSTGSTAASSGGGTNNAGVIAGTPVTLPVSFLGFDAQKSGQEDVISWVTSKTVQHVQFTVQRSADGQVFGNIATLDGISDDGGSESYAYDDASPLPGKNYYRIEEQDVAGGTYYTSVALVDWTSASAAFRIYPNPAHGQFTVTVSAGAGGPVSVTIEALSGDEVYSQSFEPAGTSFSVALPTGVAPGIYMIRLATKAGVQTGKLLVQ